MRPEELEPAIVSSPDLKTLFVNGSVVTPTQQDEVGERGGPTLGPVPDVVSLAERQITAREAAAVIAEGECAPKRCRNRASSRADLHDHAVGIVAHLHAAGVAREALRRFRGNARTPFHDGLAGRVGIGQHVSIDVNDHLIALARGTRIEPVMKCRLGDQHQGVGLLLLEGARFRKRVVGLEQRRLGPQAITGRGQGLDQHRAGFRRQPASDDDAAVHILIHVKCAMLVASVGLLPLLLPIDAAPAADDPFDVLGRARAPDREEPLLRRRRGDSGERPDLGLRELAVGQRLLQPGEPFESSRDTDALARGTDIETHAVGEPRCTRAEAVVPALADIELTDEIEQARGGGVEVNGEHRDLIAQLLE